MSSLGRTATLPMAGGRLTVWLFPVAVATAVIGMTALRLSGSSIGMYRLGQPDPDLIWGEPLAVRGDEWINRTPVMFNQVLNGSPPSARIGVGEHNLSVLGDQPTANWPILLRPDNLPSLWLDPAHSLAWSWWSLTAIAALGTYSLGFALTRRVWVSISVSLLVALSPFMEWWHLDGALATIGLVSGAGAAILGALRASRASNAAVLSLLGGCLFVGAVLPFYPPYLIACSLVVGPLTVAVALAHVQLGVVSRRRAASVFGTTVLTTVALLGAFALSFADVLALIAGSSYPGTTRYAGGGGYLAQLLSAPFSPEIARAGWPTTAKSNASEISAPFLLILPALPMLPGLLSRTQPQEVRWSTKALLASFSILLVWCLLPVPAWTGTALGLDRVAGTRTVIGLGLASVLLWALGVAHAQLTRKVLLQILAVIGLSLVIAWIGAEQLRSLNPDLDPWRLAWLGVAWAILCGLLAWGRGAPAVLVASACACLTLVTVNPLYLGSGALGDSAITAAVRSTAALDDEAAWVTYGDHPQVNALVVASGVPTFSAVNYYPDPGGWHALLGERRAEQSMTIWNRYSNQLWNAGGNLPTVQLIQQDAVNVGVSPCSPRLASIAIRFVVYPLEAASGECMTLLTSADYQGVRFGVFYLRTDN